MLQIFFVRNNNKKKKLYHDMPYFRKSTTISRKNISRKIGKPSARLDNILRVLVAPVDGGHLDLLRGGVLLTELQALQTNQC